MAQGALQGSDGVHEVLCYIEFSIFSKFPTLVENSQLYTWKDAEPGDWSEAKNCQLKKAGLPLVFGEVHF